MQSSVINPPSFRIPKTKILATHFLAQGWAANFWSYLNLAEIDGELDLIQSMGFNTLILLVPWTGFQTHVSPVRYYEPYWQLFEQLLDKIKQKNLALILRVGYAHDNGPVSEPEGFHRAITIVEEPILLAAWTAYLDRLWGIAQHYSNVLGGFITWEDFFLMDLTHIPLEQRLIYAKHTGYQRYLEKNHTLQDIAKCYQENFKRYADIPIPAFQSSAIHLFCQFWDNLLIETLFKTSKQHFPALSMEVRIDCDLEETRYICHHNTFDLSEDTDISMIYYTPAWGATNDGKPESVESLLQRMQFMFEQVKSHTNNAIFIDQLNFIDNTPGFEQHSQVAPQDAPKFLAAVAPLLQQYSVGYAMWTLHDVRANALKNGLFIHDYPSWEIKNAEYIREGEKTAVRLNTDGQLSQRISRCAGIPYVAGQPFQLDFKYKTTGNETQMLQVLVINDQQKVYDLQWALMPTEHWQAIHLTDIPFYLGYELRFNNNGAAILLADCYLYQNHQENGVIDAQGKAKPFYDDLVALNRQLNPDVRLALMNIKKFDQQQTFLHFLAHDPYVDEHQRFETGIMAFHQTDEEFLLNGYCKVCGQASQFLVDKLYGSQTMGKTWLPNWRERLVCCGCQLNNRQRAMLDVVITAAQQRQSTQASVAIYAMEQITPLFQHLSQYSAEVYGSEYLGETLEGGTIVDGVRHENVEALSFADQSFDIITSNDVLEHVNLPERALQEMYRVLKPNGEVFISLPFHLLEHDSVRRASLIDGVLHHYLPSIYHGNPLSADASLVFHDFGWDFIHQLKTAGFQQVYLAYYGSYLYGYLGSPQYFFWAQKA
jgi:SAM-dependent methyltransferase